MTSSNDDTNADGYAEYLAKLEESNSDFVSDEDLDDEDIFATDEWADGDKGTGRTACKSSARFSPEFVEKMAYNDQRFDDQQAQLKVLTEQILKIQAGQEADRSSHVSLCTEVGKTNSEVANLAKSQGDLTDAIRALIASQTAAPVAPA